MPLARCRCVGPPTRISPLISPRSSRSARRGRIANVLGNFDVWLVDLAATVSRRFTFYRAGDVTPSGLRTGAGCVFTSTRNGRAGLFERSATEYGRRAGRRRGCRRTAFLVAGRSAPGVLAPRVRSQASISGCLPMTGERKPLPVVQTPGDQFGGEISPDGRWLAYESNESGRQDIYLQSLPRRGRENGRCRVAGEPGRAGALPATSCTTWHRMRA